jgi:hypothetical protein
MGGGCVGEKGTSRSVSILPNALKSPTISPWQSFAMILQKHVGKF